MGQHFRIIFRAEIQTLMDTCIGSCVGYAALEDPGVLLLILMYCVAVRISSQWLMDFSFLE